MTVPPLPIGRAPSSYWRTAERMERLHQLPRRHRLHPSGGFLIVSRETPRRSLRGEYSAVAVHLLLQVDDLFLLGSRQDLEGMRPCRSHRPGSWPGENQLLSAKSREKSTCLHDITPLRVLTTGCPSCTAQKGKVSALSTIYIMPK